MNWTAKVVFCSSLVGITIFCFGIYLWAQHYKDRLPPSTRIGGVVVGGMDPKEVRKAFQRRMDDILTDGIEVVVKNEQKTLSLVTLSSGDAEQDVDFELDETLDRLMATHKKNALADAASMFLSLLTPSTVSIPMTLQKNRIQANALALFPDAEVFAQPAAFNMSFNLDTNTWGIGIVDGGAGTTFQWDPFFEKLKRQLVMPQPTPIQLLLANVVPRVFSEDEKQVLINKAATALQTTASYEILYQDLTWTLTKDELATMLSPGEDLRLTLLEKPLASWISSITQDINQIPRDARLTIQNGRVVDFVESLEGRTLDENQLKEDFLALITLVQEEPIEPIELTVTVTQPIVTTQDVNDLGIDEVLGVGTSSYHGSPTNRRGNIQNGVNLLHGILIAPGETFSLLKALSPFTYENGYLPELVIKGDKITPEIGGGLCQIGTTTFRAAMNAGLPIMERQNHSLVVSYYNDPSNGNPGTDATIYEPAPDFKFLNNTGSYILFQAENITDTQELRFTFWGTQDGRKASYSPPVVSRWIPVAQTQNIQTLDLEPGIEQCQGSHIGADASFVYTVVSAQGETTETLFESHYRPLPRICLVGVEELTNKEEPEASSSTEISPETSTEMPPTSDLHALSTEILAPASGAP